MQTNRFSRWWPSRISDQIDFSYLWSTSHPPASYQVSSQLVFLSSGEEAKNRFSNGGHGNHLWFPIWTILSIFDLQVTLMLPTKFQVNWPFGSGEEAKNRLSRCQHGGHLGFRIGTISAIFYLQVTLMLPTKFQVNWPFGSGQEAKNRFLRWSWIFDRNDFCYFWSTSRPNASYQVSGQLAFGFRRGGKNRFSRWQPWWPSWTSDRKDFSYFWSTSRPDASYQALSQLAFCFRRCEK